jgi:hypothetical protein
VPVGELTLEQELERTKAELIEERNRADAFADVIASQSEKIWTLSNKVRSLESKLAGFLRRDAS